MMTMRYFSYWPLYSSITPFEPYAAADRPLVIAAGNDALFGRLCAAVGRADLAADPDERYDARLARYRTLGLSAQPAPTP